VRIAPRFEGWLMASKAAQPEQNYGAARYGPVGVYNLPEDRTVTQKARSTSRVLWMIYTVAWWWVVTEFLAWRFKGDARLGQPLLRGVYLPWDWIWWCWTFYPAHFRSIVYAQFVHTSIYYALCIAVVGFVLSLVMAKRDYRRALIKASRAPDLRGSAHWASPQEIWEMKLLAKKPKGVR
jgi:hypothetical protein